MSLPGTTPLVSMLFQNCMLIFIDDFCASYDSTWQWLIVSSVSGFPRVLPTAQWENLALSLTEMFFSSWVFSSSSRVSYISCTGRQVLYH